MALGETELASLFLQFADGAQLLKGEPRFLPRRREEDGSIYEDVWDVFLGKDEPAAGCAPLHGDGAFGGQAHFILKRAKDHEAEIYRTFLSPAKSYAPRLWTSAERGGDTFLLLEYVEGENLQRATMRKLVAAVNSLRTMQDEYWGSSPSTVGLSFETSFASLKKRRQYLLSPLLERHFDEFLSLYEALPKTLCHADLLPFNLIVCRDEERAVLLDWEAGGILPYPESLARLIAHGRTHGELFRMTPRQPISSFPKRVSGCSSEISTGGESAPIMRPTSARRLEWRGSWIGGTFCFRRGISVMPRGARRGTLPRRAPRRLTAFRYDLCAE